MAKMKVTTTTTDPAAPAIEPVVTEVVTEVPKFTGVYTTEFWLTVLTLVAASVLLGLDKIDAGQWMIVGGGSSGAYSLARGLSKVNPPKV